MSMNLDVFYCKGVDNSSLSSEIEKYGAVVTSVGVSTYVYVKDTNCEKAKKIIEICKEYGNCQISFH